MTQKRGVVVDKATVEAIYGLDPEEIGRHYRWYFIDDGDLIVTALDSDKKNGLNWAHRESMQHTNFMWISGDVLDKRIIHYRFAPLGMTKAERRKRYEEKYAPPKEKK